MAASRRRSRRTAEGGCARAAEGGEPCVGSTRFAAASRSATSPSRHRQIARERHLGCSRFAATASASAAVPRCAAPNTSASAALRLLERPYSHLTTRRQRTRRRPARGRGWRTAPPRSGAFGARLVPQLGGAAGGLASVRSHSALLSNRLRPMSWTKTLWLAFVAASAQAVIDDSSSSARFTPRPPPFGEQLRPPRPPQLRRHRRGPPPSQASLPSVGLAPRCARAPLAPRRRRSRVVAAARRRHVALARPPRAEERVGASAAAARARASPACSRAICRLGLTYCRAGLRRRPAFGRLLRHRSLRPRPRLLRLRRHRAAQPPTWAPPARRRWSMNGRSRPSPAAAAASPRERRCCRASDAGAPADRRPSGRAGRRSGGGGRARRPEAAAGAAAFAERSQKRRCARATS